MDLLRTGKKGAMSQQIERKCSECGHWNVGHHEHCESCGALIDPQKKLVVESEKRELARANGPKSRLDKVVNHFKTTKNPFLKLIYLVLSALWFVYWVILSFILWAIAASPG